MVRISKQFPLSISGFVSLFAGTTTLLAVCGELEQELDGVD